MRRIVLLCVVAGLTQAVAQTGASKMPDPSTWESFFRQVKDFKRVVGTLTRPTPQEAIGLTDPEASILSSTASDCEAQLDALGRKRRELTFESRIEYIQAGDVSKGVSEKLQAIDTLHDQVVRDHIRRLKLSTGEIRFKVIEDFIQERAPSTRQVVVTETRADGSPQAAVLAGDDFFPIKGAPTVVAKAP